mmetsp:Transcript_1261/g.1805  ORF Transcript_1261/g.1805 Transcript_1261/m.1805 type:complete len:232 (+) Transcript_1261:134-829(+)
MTIIKIPIDLIKPPKLTRPTPGLLLRPNSGLHKFSELSTSFNAKNPTKLKKYPKFCPMELHTGPLPRFFLDNIVSAHPSNAISCVAIRKYRRKKKAVTPFTSKEPKVDSAPTAAAAASTDSTISCATSVAVSTTSSATAAAAAAAFLPAAAVAVIFSSSPKPSCCSTYPLPATMTNPAAACTGTNQLFLRPNFREKTASTIGAHSNFKLNGQEHKAKIACALYAILATFGW